MTRNKFDVSIETLENSTGFRFDVVGKKIFSPNTEKSLHPVKAYLDYLNITLCINDDGLNFSELGQMDGDNGNENLGFTVTPQVDTKEALNNNLHRYLAEGLFKLMRYLRNRKDRPGISERKVQEMQEVSCLALVMLEAFKDKVGIESSLEEDFKKLVDDKIDFLSDCYDLNSLPEENCNDLETKQKVWDILSSEIQELRAALLLPSVGLQLHQVVGDQGLSA